MATPDNTEAEPPRHPLLKSFNAWKDAEETERISFDTYVKETGDINHRNSQGRPTRGMPETVTFTDRTLDKTMVNLRREQYEKELNKFLTAYPERKRDEVESELAAERSADTGQEQ